MNFLKYFFHKHTGDIINEVCVYYKRRKKDTKRVFQLEDMKMFKKGVVAKCSICGECFICSKK
jgi:hypothetical protein